MRRVSRMLARGQDGQAYQLLRRLVGPEVADQAMYALAATEPPPRWAGRPSPWRVDSRSGTSRTD